MQHPGVRIREHFMASLGVTPSQLATGLGIDRSTVGRLLAGEHRLTPTMAARLGAYFGVPARWFLLMQAERDAEVLGRDTSLTQGVVPLHIGDEWLMTPDGAMSLDRIPQQTSTRGVRTVRLDNGSLALFSEAS